MKKKFLSVSLAVVVGASIVGLAAGCTTTSATQADQKTTNSQLQTYEANQPIPFNTWSQYRQTVIDVEQAEIHGVATTSFFFNQGNPNPIKSCPSIGFPVDSTSQLTNPSQVTNGGSAPNTSNENVTIGQAEPNGTYTGQSTGTYVVCVSSDGQKRPDYWEGFVETEGGAAHWDKTTGQIVDDGASTVTTTTHK